MMEDKKKLGVWEIASGKMIQALQDDFEKAQLVAFERGVKTKVSLEITIHPPKGEDENYGNLEFKHSITEPPKSSFKYHALFKGGRIVRDADSPELLTQISLDLELPKTVPFQPKVVKGGAE